jgi:hypothetical protein
MHGIYTYIPETNHVPRGYIVAAILSVVYGALIVLALPVLFFYVSVFRSMCAVPNMAVLCSSLTSWFPGILFILFHDCWILQMCWMYGCAFKNNAINTSFCIMFTTCHLQGIKQTTS